MRKLVLTALLAAGATACGDALNSRAYGEYNGIVAAMDPALWDEVGEDIYGALEPTIQTVTNERTFTVTFQDPAAPEWRNLRRFRQMLLVGTGDEPWMREAMDKAREPITGPGIYSVWDVWARDQHATIILLSAAGAADEVRAHLAEINEALDAQYRAWARNRMFLSGVDSALSDTLRSFARFELLLPDVYRWTYQDSTFLFRNDQPDPSELIRQIAVTWKTPVPPDMQPDGILEWRTEVARSYNEPQALDLSLWDAGPFQYRGNPAYQIQATWVNPPEQNWPAAGPFITRAVICPAQSRMYLLDAWLYAPGKEKYEYMIQLETILDSFRCGPA
ncbi:MAG: hypothetical protein AMXMBFR53_33640 [Gemmatimonadota bacterium]